MTFADKLKAYRKILGITQDRCAELLQISVRELRYWEAGEKLPSDMIQKGSCAVLDEFIGHTVGHAQVPPQKLPTEKPKKDGEDDSLTFG